jgi:ADP-heptose:LPS heptosyltransferase
MNQTTIMHKIALQLPEFEHYFTPYYADGYVGFLARHNLLDFTILGGEFRKRTLEYLINNELTIDIGGRYGNYDLVFTCSDLIIPKNIRNTKLILVQEGMTDPEDITYHLVKHFRFPRWLSTAATGLSDKYDLFCVASENYKDLFIAKGINPQKLVVTGIPNFDNCIKYLDNDFPLKGYVLVATSDMRETFKYENRKRFIKKVIEIANGRQLVFKLHPNENIKRAVKEIKKYTPNAIIYDKMSAEVLIANCDTLVTHYSSVVYVALALGKKVFADFDTNGLLKLLPIQNGGKSAERIASAAKKLLEFDEIENPAIFHALDDDYSSIKEFDLNHRTMHTN